MTRNTEKKPFLLYFKQIHSSAFLTIFPPIIVASKSEAKILAIVILKKLESSIKYKDEQYTFERILFGKFSNL